MERDLYKNNLKTQVCSFFSAPSSVLLSSCSPSPPNFPSLHCSFHPVHSPSSSQLLCPLSHSSPCMNLISIFSSICLCTFTFSLNPPPLAFLFSAPRLPPLFSCLNSFYHSSSSPSSSLADTPLSIFSHHSLQLHLMPHKKPCSNDDQDPATHME